VNGISKNYPRIVCILYIDQTAKCYYNLYSTQRYFYLGDYANDIVDISIGWSHICLKKSNNTLKCINDDNSGFN